jgi:hypothetical protein
MTYTLIVHENVNYFYYKIFSLKLEEKDSMKDLKVDGTIAMIWNL